MSSIRPSAADDFAYLRSKPNNMKSLAIGCSLVLASCIGTDVLDDPLVPEKLTLAPESLALMVGQQAKPTASYLNEYGVPADVPISWSVTFAAVASVTADGTVTALAPGQTVLTARANNARDSIRITVVGDLTSVAQIEIAAPRTALNPGESVSLTAAVKNINGQSLSGKTVTWLSSNQNVITVSASGVATAVAAGMATVTATADGVQSNALVFTSGSAARTGTFVRSGGYEASGTATLTFENSVLTLTLSSDFKTSFALGTYIYLANNNTSASAIRTNGFEVMQITKNGAHTFNITNINSNVKLEDYKYVIVLCKPAPAVFGYAEMK